jgi:hypothetical protein
MNKYKCFFFPSFFFKKKMNNNSNKINAYAILTLLFITITLVLQSPFLLGGKPTSCIVISTKNSVKFTTPLLTDIPDGHIEFDVNTYQYIIGNSYYCEVTAIPIPRILKFENNYKVKEGIFIHIILIMGSLSLTLLSLLLLLSARSKSNNHKRFGSGMLNNIKEEI